MSSNDPNTLSSNDDHLGSITADELQKFLKYIVPSPGQQGPVSPDRLGDNLPHQFAVMAHFIVDENAKTKKLSTIVLRGM